MCYILRLYSEIYYILQSEMWLFCFGSGNVCYQHQNFRFRFWNNSKSKKNVWTEFVPKISKSHHLSQKRNSSIFYLLRKGTGPEGSICIEISLCCHKQIYSRTDVNGMKILQTIFIISHLFFPVFVVSHLFIGGKVERGKVQKLIRAILSWDNKGRDPYNYLFRVWKQPKK